MVHGAVLLKAILGGEVLPWFIEEAEMRVLVASEAAINEQGRKPLSCVAAAEGRNMAQTNLMNERQQMLRMQACLCLAPPPHLFPFFFPDPYFPKFPLLSAIKPTPRLILEPPPSVPSASSSSPPALLIRVPPGLEIAPGCG